MKIYVLIFRKNRAEKKLKILSRAEELLLLAIWRLQDNAYGVTIRQQIKEVTNKTWAFGALFVTLDRLVKNGMLESYLSEPTKERGGRSKRIYKLTPDGLSALTEIKKIEEAMWRDISSLALDNTK